MSNTKAELSINKKRKQKIRNQKIKDFLYLLIDHKMGKIGVGIIVIFLFVALAAPLLRTVSPHQSGNASEILIPPNSQFILGTDDLGRDVWSQVLYGSRVSSL